MAAIATTIAAAPVALPALVLKIAGYLAVAADVASAVSQRAVQGNKEVVTNQYFDNHAKASTAAVPCFPSLPIFTAGIF